MYIPAGFGQRLAAYVDAESAVSRLVDLVV